MLHRRSRSASRWACSRPAGARVAVDYAGSFFAFVGVSSPVYFTAIIGVLVFAVWLGWLPAFGQRQDPFDQLRHLILPAVALALGMIALTSRMTRSAMIEVLASDYIEAARAKGLPERTILVKHALRNALIPVLTVISLQVGFLVVGTVLVEHTLGLGGLGSPDHRRDPEPRLPDHPGDGAAADRAVRAS